MLFNSSNGSLISCNAFILILYLIAGSFLYVSTSFKISLILFTSASIFIVSLISTGFSEGFSEGFLDFDDVRSFIFGRIKYIIL